MITNYITQAEFVAEHPEVDITPFSSATISGMIATASEYIDNFCQVSGFALTIVSNEKSKAIIKNNGDLVVFPNRTPVSDVSSVVVHRGTLTIALTLSFAGNTLWELPYGGNYVVFPSAYMTQVGTFTVYDLRELRNADAYTILSYTGGYSASDMPRSIKKACMLLLRDQLTKRLNVAGASQVTQGGLSIKYSNRDDGKSADVQSAENMLADYVRRTPA